MEPKPCAAQCRHKLRDLPGLKGRIGQDKEDNGHRNGGDPLGFKPCLKEDEHHRDAPGKSGGKLELVGQGQASGDNAPDRQIGGITDCSHAEDHPGALGHRLLFEHHAPEFQYDSGKIAGKASEKQDIQHNVSSFLL